MIGDSGLLRTTLVFSLQIFLIIGLPVAVLIVHASYSPILAFISVAFMICLVMSLFLAFMIKALIIYCRIERNTAGSKLLEETDDVESALNTGVVERPGVFVIDPSGSVQTAALDPSNGLLETPLVNNQSNPIQDSFKEIPIVINNADESPTHSTTDGMTNDIWVKRNDTAD